MVEENADVGANEHVDTNVDEGKDANASADQGGKETILGGDDKAADAAAKDDAAKPDANPLDDWRDLVAGGDEKFRKHLDRVSDLSKLGQSYRALESKFKSGEYRRALPKDATEEDVAAWRKENGVPDSTEGYVKALELPNGMVLGEEDKPVAESFAQTAMDNNWTPEQYNTAVSWYYQQQDAQRQQQDERDAEFQAEAEEQLRADWPGADFKRNKTAANNLLNTWPEDLQTAVLAGRTPDGKLIGDHPGFVKAMAALAMELNPAATLVPGNAGDPAKGIAGRLDELRGWMKAPQGSDEWKKYWKDDNVQEEYRKLLSAQTKMQDRAA